MTKLNIIDIKGKSSGELNLDTIPEGFEADKILIARSLKRQLANARIPCAHVKGRSEIRGGGRKPFRQKGLGRARQGSTRSIQWVGGAVAFGPQRNRNYEIGMNKKERRAALRHLIWSKIQDGSWFLVGDLKFKEPSTKKGRKFLESLKREGKFMVVLPSDEKFDNLRKSLRNIPGVKIMPPDRLNTFDLLNTDTIISHEDAFEVVRTTWKV